MQLLTTKNICIRYLSSASGNTAVNLNHSPTGCFITGA